jgi:hypothetical protein
VTQYVVRERRLGNLATPVSVQKLQTALHAKAKTEAGYRFYALYASHFDQIVDSLPANAPLLIDMTNFNGMGTLLYPSFRRLLSRTPVVKWKVSSSAARQLHEVGVAATDLDVVQGLYCAFLAALVSRKAPSLAVG